MSEPLSMLPDGREATDFEKQIWSHRKILISIALRFLRHFPNPHSLSEELVQDSMLKAFRHASNFKADANLKTWLISITRNTVLDFLRTQKGKTFEPLDDPLGNPRNLLITNHTEEQFIACLDSRRLEAALSSLSLRYRKILMLRYQEKELSYEEISAQLRIPVGTVKSSLNRAIFLLRTYMDFSISISPGSMEDVTEVDVWNMNLSELED